mmetsp:Transcript_78995/g.189699  ORF Transcript_78995/g.189699 Transcript_78995/m.189699 type:complete len:241 (+) Transcript_78995:882-1604(+)
MEEKRPFHTCPNATSIMSGITGFVRISSRSNCIALAAAWRAFTCSLWDQDTAAHRPSGTGFGFSWPLAATGPSSLAAAAAGASPDSSALLRASFSSSDSFFFRCRRPFGSSLSAVSLTLAVLGASALAAVAASAASAASLVPAAAGASSSDLASAARDLAKATMRITGKHKKFTTVGNGPMTTVVTKAKPNRSSPRRHKYPPNCRRSLYTKLSQRRERRVFMIPASKVMRFHTNSQKKPM